MKEIQATIYKEFKETRVFTFVFFLLGVLFPLAVYAQGYFSNGRWFSFESRLGAVSFGGLIAVWLNTLCLSSSAFAREHENKTFDVLRRVTSDWRRVAVGKFAYVALASTVLALFFVNESFIFDAIFQKAPGATLLETFKWTANPQAFSSTFLVGLAEVFVWGAFWTARCRRQTVALFATLLTSLLWANLGAIAVADRVDYIPYETFVRTFGLFVLLPFIPGKRRFGFLEKATDETNEQEPQQDPKQIADEWNVVTLERPTSFVALLQFVASAAPLLGRGLPAFAVELTLFMIVTAICFLPSGSENGNLLGSSATFFLLCYLLVFTSGMFRTSKKQELETLLRLNVSPFSYWLANIVFYGGYCLALLGVFVGLVGIDFFRVDWFVKNFSESPIWLLNVNCVLLPIIGFVFSAAEPGSRLVVWGRSILYCVLWAFVSAFCILLNLGATPNVQYALMALSVSFACGVVELSFLFGSYFLVKNRMLCRQSKAPWFVPWSVAIVIFAAVYGSLSYSNLVFCSASFRESNSGLVFEPKYFFLAHANVFCGSVDEEPIVAPQTQEEQVKLKNLLDNKTFETTISGESLKNEEGVDFPSNVPANVDR